MNQIAAITTNQQAMAARAPRRPQNRGRTTDGKPNPIDIHIGDRIRQRRTMQGISQEQLGETLNLTFQQVQKYERGANRVSGSRLYDIARALDVPVSFFFDDMPNDVAAASPAGLCNGAPAPEIQTAAYSRLELDLMRQFRRIPNPEVRASFLRTVTACANASAGEG